MKKNYFEIYVITHKKIKEINIEGYKLLQVGCAFNENLGYVSDNTGDNISIKNKNYCELTGMYWIWKNSKADITGLVHYRRFFYKNMFSNKEENILSKQEISEILKNYDCIVTKKSKLPYGNIEKYYNKNHHSKDYKITREVIKKIYPDYIDSFEKVSKSNYYYNLNMIICNKKLFDEYSEWLFNILFEVEKLTDISSYTDYQKRIYGFLSEILLRVWLDQKKLKIKECYVYNNEIGFGVQFLKRLIMKCIINR